jgi:hypothetical protein
MSVACDQMNLMCRRRKEFENIIKNCQFKLKHLKTPVLLMIAVIIKQQRNE